MGLGDYDLESNPVSTCPNPLFLMGSKRSGSTILTILLNAHPEVFVTHESDIIWILFQASQSKLDALQPHPLDGPNGINATRRACLPILKSVLGNQPRRSEVQEAFYRVQNFMLKRSGSSFRAHIRRSLHAMRLKTDPYRKTTLKWIGDKKHAQHLDPAVREFLRSHFPAARYIHIIRHPKGVVASMMRAAQTWDLMPDYFRGTSEQILEQWAELEERVLQAKKQEDCPIISVRLEDLVEEPVEAMEKLMHFLDLEMTHHVRSHIDRHLRRQDPNAKYAAFSLPEVPRARAIMELYGYA